jgi:hypothetical protein
LAIPAGAQASGANTAVQDKNQSVAQEPSAKTQVQPANPDAEVVGDEETAAPATLRANGTPEQKRADAWKMLADAVHDGKHPQTQIFALVGLGTLRSPEAEKLIMDAMKDSDLDVRTAAAIAATQTQDRNLTTPLRNLLDDKEPQVQFAAAVALWKMGDRSGEDILMSIVEGDKSAHAGLMHGTEHKISRDLHDPSKLAKLGAMQGAAMLLGPFGVGISAIQFIHQSGGNAARVSAIEQLSEEKTPPIHKDLIDALQDKDAPVRAAAAKALSEYHDSETQKAVYALMADPKSQVRLMAAAAYLRTTGTPGPAPARRVSTRPERKQRTLHTK